MSYFRKLPALIEIAAKKSFDSGDQYLGWVWSEYVEGKLLGATHNTEVLLVLARYAEESVVAKDAGYEYADVAADLSKLREWVASYSKIFDEGIRARRAEAKAEHKRIVRENREADARSNAARRAARTRKLRERQTNFLKELA